LNLPDCEESRQGDIVRIQLEFSLIQVGSAPTRCVLGKIALRDFLPLAAYAGTRAAAQASTDFS
jgi:hypothetical protein